mmetsp:Transcript_66566/g.214526  ORF Transcript_66566/g.214526 Transcript_66566/m.214526 type:complete len:108 (+) Transcript_66566:100-423(+)
MAVTACADRTAFNEQLEAAGEKAVFVDFTATWCGPCQKIKEPFHQLAKDNPNGVFLSVDVDENEEVAEKYGVNAMPTFMVFKSKEMQESFTGADIKRLEELVKKYTS